MIKRDYVVIALNLVLYSKVVSLCLWDVFVLICDVKLGMQVCEVTTHWLKLIVCEHNGNFEISGGVYTYQGLKVLEYYCTYLGRT